MSSIVFDPFSDIPDDQLNKRGLSGAISPQVGKTVLMQREQTRQSKSAKQHAQMAQVGPLRGGLSLAPVGEGVVPTDRPPTPFQPTSSTIQNIVSTPQGGVPGIGGALAQISRGGEREQAGIALEGQAEAGGAAAQANIME